MISLFLLFSISYLALIFVFILGNKKLKNKGSSTKELSVSVLIPFRNEEGNLGNLTDDLLNQTYSKEKIEFVFVDDHSVDRGAEIVKNKMKDRTVQLLSLSKQEGKKAAIKFGVESASNEIIITTDADCRMSRNWLKAMLSYYQPGDTHLLLGPVQFVREKGLWNRLLRTEFAALISTTSAAVGIKNAFMANGANLLFNKSLFLSIDRDSLQHNVASGDDVFLLHAIKQKFGKKAKILFAAEPSAMVSTSAPKNLKDFISQRIRWASKSKYYRDSFTKFVGFLIFLGNTNLVLSLVLIVFSLMSIKLLIAYFVIKWLVDSLLIFSTKKWNNQHLNLLDTFLLSLLYPLYIISIALLSLLFKPKWKGRKLDYFDSKQ